ncbi:MAG: hypothetical protein P4L84_25665 [Isosphaeraceae bacterium]|nr:hypothetical protein [Isosphaeraceae bacterium]
MRSAGEKVCPEYVWPANDTTESEQAGPLRVLALPAPARIKFTSFGLKERVHLHDLIDVELIDAGWLPALPRELAQGLQALLDNAEARSPPRPQPVRSGVKTSAVVS